MIRESGTSKSYGASLSFEKNLYKRPDSRQQTVQFKYLATVACCG